MNLTVLPTKITLNRKISSANRLLADLEGNREHIQLDFTRVIPELDFAVRNHLKVRGHILIWHSQTPD